MTAPAVVEEVNLTAGGKKMVGGTNLAESMFPSGHFFGSFGGSSGGSFGDSGG
jgi:hypothetical protein